VIDGGFIAEEGTSPSDVKENEVSNHHPLLWQVFGI
jgi:hypothetical protein